MNKQVLPEMFSKISKKYDFLNHLLSLGMDKNWRKKLVEQAKVKPGERILDICTGTGDIAIEFARRNYTNETIGIDLSEKMLSIAQHKVERMKLQKIRLRKGDCLNLPFKDYTFDIVTIGFGLRNLTDYKKGIAEMARVLKNGGRLLMLDFSLPRNALLSKIYQFYLKKIIPSIGRFVSGSKSAYKYLSSSIQDFPKQKEVLEIMKTNKLKNLCFKELTGGIVSIYKGEK